MNDQQTFIIGGPNAERAESALKALREFFGVLDKSRRWRVTIELYVPKRSEAQNNLYQKWLDIIANETGNDRDDVREHVLSNFCPLKPKRNVFGDVIMTRSTSLLDVQEMKQYMDKVMAWAARDLNIRLPLPEDHGGER